MYALIKDVIAKQDFVLNDLLKKIDVLWVQGTITDEQKTELITAAKTNANIDQHINFGPAFAALNARISALELKFEELLKNSELESETETEAAEDPDAFVPGKTYYAGNKIRFTDGEIYVCTAPPGAVCVWSPTDYPTYWEKLTNTEEE